METTDTPTADITDRLKQLEERLDRLERKQPPNDYQGWSSYETWVVSLWMDNDAKQYLRMKGIAQKHLADCAGDREEAAVAFGKDLQKETEDNVPSYLNGVYDDLLSGALSQVNYFEIARHWLQDIDLPPPKAEPTPKETAPTDKPPAEKDTLTASAEVLDVLRRSTIDDEGLTLPPEQLPREQYDAVNEFLEVAGARWSKTAKRHLFKSGAKEKIEGLLTSGQILDEQKHFQAFYTPDEVARNLVRIAEVKPDMECLEPSAGAGAIARALREAGASVTCMDLNPEATEVLRLDGFNTFTGDFLTIDPDPKYDRVVMNPPFTNDQDIDHVLHAYKFLKPGGKLVAIMAKGFAFGENKKRSAFRDFLKQHGRIALELPAGTFKEAGTMVATVVVEITQKPQDEVQMPLLAA